MTSVIHIDQSILFREGLKRLLADSPFKVVWHGATWEDAADNIAALKPQIVIADFQGEAGILEVAVEALRRLPQQSRLLLLSDNAPLDFLGRALAVGVDGYVTKDISSRTLKILLQLLHEGQKIFPSDLTQMLVENRFQANGAQGRERLSMREVQILSHLRNGLSNKEIANILHITEGTVKVHLKAVLKKVNVHNRTQAAVWAINNGVSCAELP